MFAMTKQLSVALAVFVALFPLRTIAAPLPAHLRKPPHDIVVLDTSAGRIKVRLFTDKAPLTVKNFLGYVDANFYSGTIFHRVIPDFMLQGGGLDGDLNEKPAREPVRNESANGLVNRRGTIAVARMAAPDSGTCQFFINVKDNTFLDRPNSPDGAGYCVFGEVVEGMDVVDAIAHVQTGNRGAHQNVPLQNVVIQSVRRVR
jgi:peptidyl-prolyl cis-trans isomerase A (cyclophilin A)